MLDTARASALGRPFGAPRARRNLRADQDAQDHAGLRQHPQPGRNPVPGAVAHQRRQSRHRAASRLARRRAAPQGRGRDDGRASCARWSAPRRSISASTGATSISSSMSARRRAASRLLQRIGRANHRLDEPSEAVLVPANRFEVLECRAALDAVAENAQDTPPLRTGALDVLAQHVLGRACGEPFLADELYAEVRAAAPYAGARRAPISTPRSISSPPAATRSRPTSASPRSGRARTAAGASPIRASRSATA